MRRRPAASQRQRMANVTRAGDGFMLDAGFVGNALGIDPASVPGRMRKGEVASRCEKVIDEQAGRFRLTLFGCGRALRLTVDREGNILSRAMFHASPRRASGERRHESTIDGQR